MTPEDLTRLILEAKPEPFVNAVADLTEAERKKLSKTAQDLYREFRRINRVGEPKEWIKELIDSFGLEEVNHYELEHVSGAAVFALGPFSVVKRLDLRGINNHYHSKFKQIIFKIMRDRRPEWIDEWVEVALRADDSMDFLPLWVLIKDGICIKPTSDEYYRSLGRLRVHELSEEDYLSLLGYPEPDNITDLILAEPILLDELWKFFEIETVAFTIDGWWNYAIQRLDEQSLIDRDRVLDGCLSGLATGFRPKTLRSYVRLFEDLKPTIDELAVRLATFCDLMTYNVSYVVNFAVKMVKKIDKEKRLDDAEFLNVANSVFKTTLKTPAKTSLALLAKISKRQPELITQITRALVPALEHPEAEVQSTAAEMLTTFQDHLEKATLEALGSLLEHLPAAVKPTIVKLLSNTGESVEVSSEMISEQDLDEQRTECRKRAEELDPKWREMAGVDNALHAVENSSWAGPLEFDILKIPVLSSLEKVEPIASQEELVEAVSQALIKVESSIEVERIIDGISRFCDKSYDDFKQRFASIFTIYENMWSSGSGPNVFSGGSGFSEVRFVIEYWLFERLVRTRYTEEKEHENIGLPDFFNVRLTAIQKRVADKKPAPLLALPTHQFGWIDPTVLVERWQQLESDDENLSQVSPFEVVQAFLRLAPDNRKLALEKASSLAHHWARSLRWALGSDDGPRSEDKGDCDIWLAAGRARAPFDVIDELAILGLENAGPDAMYPADHQPSPDFPEELHGHHGRPTVLQHILYEARSPYCYPNVSWNFDWGSITWPANLDGFYTAGTVSLIDHYESTTSGDYPNYAFIPPLFPVDRPLSSAGQLMILYGISGRDQDARLLAVDALIEAIADGRVHPHRLGNSISIYESLPSFNLSQLCKSLSEVARISSLHTWTIMEALATILSHYEELPRNSHHVLSLLQELQAQLGLPFSEEVLQKLQAIKGASKTAKLAKAICSFVPEPTIACDEARLMTLEARLDRAERWAEFGND